MNEVFVYKVHVKMPSPKNGTISLTCTAKLGYYNLDLRSEQTNCTEFVYNSLGIDIVFYWIIYFKQNSPLKNLKEKTVQGK